MKRLLCISVFTLFSSFSNAALLQVSGGQLTGASEVNIGGTLYDVAFLDGTCTAIFDGCNDVSDFTFNTRAGAEAAAQALSDQVFIDSTSYQFDSRPELTLGTSFTAGAIAYINYSFTALGNVNVISSFNSSVEANDNYWTSTVGSTLDTTLSAGSVYTKWSTAQGSVPTPATILLFSLGLVGIGITRRNRA
jgi:hypothetical protein